MKVDGVDLHRIDYIPKKRSDLEIHLYFEPDTFRHVMTVYLMTIAAPPSGYGCNASGSRSADPCRKSESPPR
jgi:hypothetical protein